MKHLLSLLILFSFNAAFSQLKPSKLFSDHIILQQNQPINIWGTHSIGKQIEVTFNKQTEIVKTDDDGYWMVSFEPMKASYKPYTINIKSGSESITYKDVLIGDVWVCSGQSNMEWILRDSENAKEEIAGGSDPYIRHFKIPKSFATSPEKTLVGGNWEIASPENVGDFTAVGYYFAKNIRKTQDIPVALLNSTWGGSRIESWMNAKTLAIDNPTEYLKNAVNEMNAVFEKSEDKLREKFPYLKEEDVDYSTTEWANPNLDISDWAKINVPNLWENEGYEGFDGQAWYRTTFQLTKTEAENGISLGLAKIDDSDYVWVNGVKIGETIQQYNAKRVYTVNAEQLVEGKNTIAIKVDDTSGGGGIYGDEAGLFVKTINQNISLAKSWDFKISSYKKPDVGVNLVSTMLYNKMIYPITDFPIKGVIWYQGEANANSIQEANAYEDLFQDMISQWRNDWNQDDFPFLWVQLANFLEPQPPNTESSWAHLRAAQTKALSLPNTAQAVIIDIGEAKDIHPKNKKDVGYRLALGARKIAYAEDLVYSGPTFKSHKIVGNTVEIEFNHLGSGLKAKDKNNLLKGFTIAGSDNNFVWANAKIEDNKVIVWSDEIKNPKYLRYAWADNPEDANLYNEEGLPACPFEVVIK